LTLDIERKGLIGKKITQKESLEKKVNDAMKNKTKTTEKSTMLFRNLFLRRKHSVLNFVNDLKNTLFCMYRTK
jgi:hypothetical protein